jgi:DNA-binding NtrC family response regulator
VSQVLIAGEDWQSRALLRAQLLEEGFGVEAFETVSDALESLEPGRTLPHLVIADVCTSDGPSAEVDALAAWSRKIPTWIIASRTYNSAQGFGGHGFEMILLRPIDIGELVEQIKRRLGGGLENE